MNGKNIYHLTHIDGDGYGSGLVTKKFLEASGTINEYKANNYYEYNANYDYIEDMIEVIINDISEKKDKNALVLITDLNFKSNEEAKKIENKLNKLGADILLVDHHDSGREASNNNDWYNLNTDDSATMLIYKKFAEENKNITINKDIKLMIKSIDNYDIYKDFGSDLFLKGEIFNGICGEANLLMNKNKKTLPEYQKAKRDYIYYMLQEVASGFEQGIKVPDMPQHIIKYKAKYLDYINNNNKLDFIINNGNLTQIEKLQLSFNKLYNLKLGSYNLSRKQEKNYKVDRQKLAKEYFIKLKRIFYIITEEEFEETELYKKIMKDKEINFEDLDIKFQDELFKIKNSLNLLYSQLMEKIYEETKKEILSNKNIDISNIKKETEILIRKKMKTDIKIKKTLIGIDVLKQTNLPYTMSIPLIVGIDYIDEKTEKQYNINNNDIKVVFDSPYSSFQHSSYIYVNEYDSNSVIINMNTQNGKIGCRASNNGASKIAKLFGGGGHPNAAGAEVKINAILNEEEIKNYNYVMKNGNKEEKQIFKDKLGKKYKEYINEKLENIEREQQKENIKNNINIKNLI